MTELISDQKTFRKLKEDPTLVILNIQSYILKVLNQLDSMKHLKYAKLSYQVLFLLFNLLSLQWALITTILLST